MRTIERRVNQLELVKPGSERPSIHVRYVAGSQDGGNYTGEGFDLIPNDAEGWTSHDVFLPELVGAPLERHGR